MAVKYLKKANKNSSKRVTVHAPILPSTRGHPQDQQKISPNKTQKVSKAAQFSYIHYIMLSKEFKRTQSNFQH